MLNKARNRMDSDEGFTLIELLVVILIIGILAAIAIPSFLNQREKGQDACAKSMARTMQTAIETYYIDNNTYVGATGGSAGTLHTIESQVADGQCGAASLVTVGLAGVAGTTAGGGGCTAAVPTVNAYCVAATSAATSTSGAAAAHAFSVARSSTGVITRVCGATGFGACVGAGTW